MSWPTTHGSRGPCAEIFLYTYEHPDLGHNQCVQYFTVTVEIDPEDLRKDVRWRDIALLYP